MTPTEQDKELRHIIDNWDTARHICDDEYGSCPIEEFFIKGQRYFRCKTRREEQDELIKLITADRKRVALEEVRNAKIVHVEMHHTDKGQFDDWCFKRQQEINDGIPPKYQYEAPPNGFASWQQFEACVEAAYGSQFTESELKAQQKEVK